MAGPGASGGGENDLFAVVIAADGNLIVRGERLANDAALAAFARQAHTKNADVRVRIDADARVTYGRVIQVMDTLKQSGISKIAFGVTPAPTPP